MSFSTAESALCRRAMLCPYLKPKSPHLSPKRSALESGSPFTLRIITKLFLSPAKSSPFIVGTGTAAAKPCFANAFATRMFRRRSALSPVLSRYSLPICHTLSAVFVPSTIFTSLIAKSCGMSQLVRIFRNSVSVNITEASHID